ncbi:hypothetical protein BK708_21715 [Bacillus thuringiensis serovar yunnanensis]|nr:hypothetical protein BK708_21715 [Bacillus thuringiensis serovar yunnanensis]
MRIAIFGTGYVGLVTGVCLSEIGHNVTCINLDNYMVKRMQRGFCPIYEPGLDELMVQNIKRKTLSFTTSCKAAIEDSDIIYIALGTPKKQGGSINLKYFKRVALDIARNLIKDAIIVIKSAVPVGTNDYIKTLIEGNLTAPIKINMVSNPEFFHEGSAIYDSFHGDRIVIGTDEVEIANVMKEVYEPFEIPIFSTSIPSAEMIKYASSAFLDAKNIFINNFFRYI